MRVHIEFIFKKIITDQNIKGLEKLGVGLFC
jgi:hypothetical protein